MCKLRALKKKTYICMSRQHPKSSWKGLKRRKMVKIIIRVNISLLIVNGQEGYSRKDVPSFLIKH